MANLITIAAIGKNNELGYNNNLIWHLKKDLDNFKKLTNNHYIVMGKNTYYSLPKKLPNRKYIIISSSLPESNDYILFKNIKDFISFFNSQEEDIYIIGGATIYKELLKYSNILILTEIDKDFNKADVYFPTFSKNNYTSKIISTYNENNINYKIVEYKKK